MGDKNINYKAGGTGLGFMEALQIVFIILKLCKVIKWSWWWVLAPTWISILLFVIVVVGFVIWVKRR